MIHIVILAAGKGTRMKSSRPKVLHSVAGMPMLECVLRTAAVLNPSSTTVVIGHQADSVAGALGHRAGLQVAVQEPQLGTGHALLQAKPLLKGCRGTLLLLSADVPLLRPRTLDRLARTHERAGAAASILTAVVDQSAGYGRIIRSGNQIVRIVEERDATAEERAVREISTGIYAFDLAPLFDALAALGKDNAQGEYYLPDLVAAYREAGRRVESVVVDDAQETRGINSLEELAEVSRLVRQKKNVELMSSGVTIEDPATTYVDVDVQVGPDTVIHPFVTIEGRSVIGSGCEIHSGVRIVDSVLGDNVTINNFCVVVGSRVATGAGVGPFAHIRPDSQVGEHARVGNFVELKKTSLGSHSKANHLTYLGDATIGSQVNVGAGTITCNYDGATKHPTTIEDDAFIGSDSQLIAPVRVSRGAYVAAGSSITEDVPPGALGIARARQVNKAGWALKRKGKSK